MTFIPVTRDFLISCPPGSMFTYGDKRELESSHRIGAFNLSIVWIKIDDKQLRAVSIGEGGIQSGANYKIYPEFEFQHKIWFLKLDKLNSQHQRYWDKTLNSFRVLYPNLSPIWEFGDSLLQTAITKFNGHIRISSTLKDEFDNPCQLVTGKVGKKNEEYSHLLVSKVNKTLITSQIVNFDEDIDPNILINLHEKAINAKIKR